MMWWQIPIGVALFILAAVTLRLGRPYETVFLIAAATFNVANAL